MTAIGDMQAFQAYQLGQAMPEAAANPAGGLAGAGVGLGMGLAMTNSMGGIGGMQGGSGGSSPTPPPTGGPPPVPRVVEWHIAEENAAVGPFTVPQLAQAISAGRVTRATLVWCAGMDGWGAAGQLEALAGLFATLPPPLPGTTREG
jgi:hypothetical protein